MDIIFATGNAGKVREAEEILGEGYHIIPATEAGADADIAETGDSLTANSLLKATHVWNACHKICFADDSGLEVDMLGGAPGVMTARYAGEGKDFNANIDKLLSEMEKAEARSKAAGTPLMTGEEKGSEQTSNSDGSATPNRRARFRCVVTLIIDGEAHVFEGVLEGTIAYARSGQGGFGYDPVFIADEYPDRTLAEISEEDKNAISHRGKAVRTMAEWLKSNISTQR